MKFKNRVALVTGGSRGIGKAISLKLASEGADVVIGYFRKKTAAEDTAQSVRASGVRTHIIKVNLAEADQIDRMFCELEENFGKLDILVNNAASGVARTAMELDTDGWDWTMDINARAALLCSQKAARLMKEGGTIINISSLGSRFVLPTYTAVGVSKAALEALTRYLAIELAQNNIRVNAVSASAVETEALKRYISSPDFPPSVVTTTPAGRMVKPEDIAEVVSFLCQDGSEMIRGQTIVIDGGLSLSLSVNRSVESGRSE